MASVLKIALLKYLAIVLLKKLKCYLSRPTYCIKEALEIKLIYYIIIPTVTAYRQEQGINFNAKFSNIREENVF